MIVLSYMKDWGTSLFLLRNWNVVLQTINLLFCAKK
jgi:hypothetical protein